MNSKKIINEINKVLNEENVKLVNYGRNLGLEGMDNSQKYVVGLREYLKDVVGGVSASCYDDRCIVISKKNYAVSINPTVRYYIEKFVKEKTNWTLSYEH